MLKDQIGEGLTWPVQTDGKGGLAEASGFDLLDADVALLIGIQQGELRWDMRRGTKDMRLLHRKYRGDVRNAITRERVVDVLSRDEPRVRPLGATAEQIADKLRIVTTYAPLGYTRGEGRSTVTEV